MPLLSIQRLRTGFASLDFVTKLIIFILTFSNVEVFCGLDFILRKEFISRQQCGLRSWPWLRFRTRVSSSAR